MAANIQGKPVGGIVIGGEIYTQDGDWKICVDTNPINKHFKSVTYTYKIFPDSKYITLYFAAEMIGGADYEDRKNIPWESFDWQSTADRAFVDLTWLVKDITRVGVSIPSNELGMYHYDDYSAAAVVLVNDKGVLYLDRTDGWNINGYPSAIGRYIHGCGINGPEPRIYYTELADGIK